MSVSVTLSDTSLFILFIYIKLCRDHNDFLSLRVEAVHSRVAELNPYVQVSVSTDVLDESTDLSFLKRYQVGLYENSSSSKCNKHLTLFTIIPIRLLISLYFVHIILNASVLLFISLVCSTNRNKTELTETNQPFLPLSAASY